MIMTVTVMVKERMYEDEGEDKEGEEEEAGVFTLLTAVLEGQGVAGEKDVDWSEWPSNALPV